MSIGIIRVENDIININIIAVVINVIVMDVAVDGSRQEGETVDDYNLKGMKERGKHRSCQYTLNEKRIIL